VLSALLTVTVPVAAAVLTAAPVWSAREAGPASSPSDRWTLSRHPRSYAGRPVSRGHTPVMPLAPAAWVAREVLRPADHRARRAGLSFQIALANADHPPRGDQGSTAIAADALQAGLPRLDAAPDLRSVREDLLALRLQVRDAMFSRPGIALRSVIHACDTMQA